MIKRKAWNKAALLLCVFAVLLLSGCRVHISVGTNDNLTGESYPDAEKYRTGGLTSLAH